MVCDAETLGTCYSRERIRKSEHEDKRLRGYSEGMRSDFTKRWNLTNLDEYIGMCITSTIEAKELLLNPIKSGKISSIEQNTLVVNLENGKVINLYWLEPLGFPKLVSLYVDSSRKFKRNFKKMNEEQQRETISNILASRRKNKELDLWLSQKYPKIVEEVGRDRTFL